MTRKKKKVWVAPDWLPAMSSATAFSAKAFVFELVGMEGDRDYKAPHAPRGTLPRHRSGRYTRMLWIEALADSIPSRRPFKGHRP